MRLRSHVYGSSYYLELALVGYDPNMFIVRNSWGTRLWGDKGFGYASNLYASDAFTEAYGVRVA